MKKKHGAKINNPYPESGYVGRDTGHEESAAAFASGHHEADASPGQSSRPSGDDSRQGDHSERRSVAGTVSPDHEASQSLNAPSHGASSLGEASRTVGGGLDSRKGGDSTFSSPAPSVRSLTTTLTTIQSMPPNGSSSNHHASAQAQNNSQSIQFTQPFPTTSPASAIPAHLAPNGAPNTYSAATANSLLTDNASILTLASSSKRRRRRSMDTDASVRALAPSSVWGGSRESLPLSILSANIDSAGTPGLHGSSSRVGAERNSIYSSTGVPLPIPGDRNSHYAKQGDGSSIRSGRPGHARTESMGTTNPGPNSPLAGQPPGEKGDKTENGDVNGNPEKGEDDADNYAQGTN